MRLKLGVFSDAKALKNVPEVNAKVGVRLKLGCGLNKGFYGINLISNILNMYQRKHNTHVSKEYNSLKKE